MKLFAQGYAWIVFMAGLCIGVHQPISASSLECIEDSSGETTCAAQIFTPTTLEELQSAVTTAINDGVLIRAFGGLHSAIEDVAVGDTNYLINMNSLDKILEIDFHKKRVKVQGGTNLYVLSHQLAKAGLKLLTQPGPYDDTVGGMAANAVHESGLNGCLCDSILEIQFVDGLGNLRTVSTTENSQWLPAARVSLGVLGPIYTVTFQCYPTNKRVVYATPSNLDTILTYQDIFLYKNDAFQFLFDPLSEATLFETFNITNAPEDNTSNRDYNHYLPNSNVVGELNTIVYPLLPTSAYPAISESIVTSGSVDIVEFFYKSYSYFHSNAISRGRIAELSIEAKYLAPAMRDLAALVQSYQSEGNDFISFAEVRYVSDKNFMYLSPTNRPSWLIGFLVIYNDDSPEAIDILQDFTNLMQNNYGGRPQWGNNPQFLTYPVTLQIYGADNVNAFNEVRRIFDPNGLFYSSYFQQRLGPL